ncbi:MAG: signal peptidase I, partial [Clostridia bacterium]|nr:signal peptidase I [Clostridia bacterium]
VIGSSMEGTLVDGDCVYAIRSSSPRRGDIVIIDTDEKPIIKRVIALGGDTVELKAGVLYLNGEQVDEPYVDPVNNTASYSKNTFSVITVPEGKMFFMGDNRDDSNDSRSKYGVMPVSSIMGIVADWSLSCKGAVTTFNNLFSF